LSFAVVAMAVAGLRLASTIAPRGLERAIAAATITISLIVVETLALGLVGLGANQVALTTAAGVTWAVAASALRSTDPRPLTELGDWWRGLSTGGRLAAASIAGVATTWALWQLRHPAIGFDSAVYHWTEVASWIHNGRPGSILSVGYDFPFGNYPLTDEVVLTWAAGISRSFVPLALWNPLLLLLLLGASWLALRNLEVSRVAAGLGAAGLVTIPLVVKQLNEPQSDLPALAWLVCTTAVATGAGRRPALLAPAVLSAGLALGTKPTPVVMVAASLCVGVYLAREDLRSIARLLGIALAGAVAVGGIWYLRNLLQHGSPLWPLGASPWGDPKPRFLQLVDTRFIERPAATVQASSSTYADQLGGGIVLLAGSLAVFVRILFGRTFRVSLRRQLIAAGGVALVGLLAWSLAPGTGLTREPGILAPVAWPISTLRYLLPTLGASTVVLALGSRVKGFTGVAAMIALAAAVAWNVIEDAQLGFPFVPGLGTVALGGAFGIVLVGLGIIARRHLRDWESLTRARFVQPVLVVLVAGLAGVALALAADGFVSRHVRVVASSPTRVGQDGLLAWLTSRPDFEQDRTPIAFASRVMLAPLAGDHFKHPLKLIPIRASCQDVDALGPSSMLVIADPAFLQGLFVGNSPYRTGECVAGRRPAYRDGIFAVYPPSRGR
jgi:hypothetical protein